MRYFTFSHDFKVLLPSFGIYSIKIRNRIVETTFEIFFFNLMKHTFNNVYFFQKELDLQRHMYNSEPQEYVLTSLVEHLGSGVDHGHYVSMNRGFDHDSWWLFDDEQVKL